MKHQFNVPVTFEGVPDAVVHELCKGAHQRDVMEAVKARKQQELALVAADKFKARDGIGQATMNINAFNYHAWARYHGTYDCWGDKGFRKYYIKKNPEAKVTAPGNTRIQVGWTPGSGRTIRFTKKYTWEKNEDRII